MFCCVCHLRFRLYSLRHRRRISIIRITRISIRKEFSKHIGFFVQTTSNGTNRKILKEGIRFEHSTTRFIFYTTFLTLQISSTDFSFCNFSNFSNGSNLESAIAIICKLVFHEHFPIEQPISTSSCLCS